MAKVRSLHDLAATVRGRRLDLGLAQAELARRARVSRKWIGELEAGKASVELGLVLRVLDELGLGLEIAESAGATPDGEPRLDLDALLDEHRGR